MTTMTSATLDAAVLGSLDPLPGQGELFDREFAETGGRSGTWYADTEES